MIITLKGADFSASNIGTLSSWRITRSLGAGATYEGPTSVDKGNVLQATITIAEGYELGTAGITVTMGGEVVSDAVSPNSDGSYTIYITCVTGNVVIKVPTVNINTGEEDEPDTPTNRYTLSVSNIPTGTDYPVNNPYKSSIFEVTTRRWLGTGTAAGCYELETFPYNSTEYLLARIDLTQFKNNGYTSITINPGANANTTNQFWTYSSSFEDTWVNKTERQNMVGGSNIISIQNKAVLYLGLRRIKDDVITHYFGETFEVVFNK